MCLQGLPGTVSKVLRRRYYLVEKARNASIVGILVGTLGVAGYLDAIDHVRSLAQRCACMCADNIYAALERRHLVGSNLDA